MRCCRLLQSSTALSDHCWIVFGSFLNIPDPEHGASTTSTSKYPSNLLKSFGSLLLTTVFSVPHLLRLSERGGIRVLIISLETSKLSSFISEFISVLFPPGDAQRS